MTIQSQTIELIPLSKLIASPRNVRRKDRKADIEALAASIAARGLLQNLCVVATDAGRYEVDAGDRRRQALKLLAKTGFIPKDHPVACNIIAREAGREVSLIENVHRIAMDAMDEVDAFSALIADGSTPAEVAQRFGVTQRHVDQRLALSGLSPRIKAAWKRGDVTLDAAKAFCLVADHGQQDAVFRSMGRPVTSATSVRSRLMDGRVRAKDRLANFVGLPGYEAAGGKLVRDLFDPDAVFIEDPALLTKLAEEKLEAAGSQWIGQGWSWVRIKLGDGDADDISSMRVYPEWREPTPDEQTELDRLSVEIEALDAELEASSVDDDPRWTQRDDLEAAYETTRQKGRFWPVELKQLGGVMLSISHDGELAATEGLVAKADKKSVEALLKSRRAELAGEDDRDADDSASNIEPRVSALPRSVNHDLTLVRTRAIRLRLSGNPDIALAVCVSALAQRTMRNREMTGVAISAQSRHLEDHPEIDAARSALEACLPTSELDLLNWALDLSRERLLDALAVLVAGAVDLAHEDSSPNDLVKQGISDVLAQQLDIDMRQFWQADLNFWARLPKSTILAALAHAPAMAKKSARTRDDLLKAHAKLRKDDLATKVATAFEGSGYLPEILLTPVASGHLEITTEGLAAIEAPAVAAE